MESIIKAVRLRKVSPAEIMISSYVLAILTGTVLLSLPLATVSGHISLVDALFTTTSAVCVTGLAVVDTGSYFTLPGQLIILLLIQLGGLGIMTFTVGLFLSLGRRVPYKQRVVLQDVFAHTPRADIYNLTKSILVYTGVIELLGAALLTWYFSGQYSWARAMYLGIFHAISAFCNAGFSLFANSFMDYRGSVSLNLIICGLIILGGLGFPVVYEVHHRLAVRESVRGKFSLQTKTVLTTTPILIGLGMLMFIIGEQPHLSQTLGPWQSLMSAFFQSVTARTAGFNTVDMASLTDATLIFIIFLMFVGASPGSCGGGIKTTTLAVLTMFGWSRLRGRAHLNMFHKTVSRETLGRSMSLLMISIGLIFIFLFLLLLLQHLAYPEAGRHFLEYLFEVVSAFGTVGLSMGATARLSMASKVLITLLMLIGRVGILTFAYLMLGTEPGNGLKHAEEKMMIG